MKKMFQQKKLVVAITMALALTGLSGCNGSDSTTAAINDTLSGVAFKGPVDGASIEVIDNLGNTLATGTSSLGKFSLPKFTIPSDVTSITIETTNGSYTDEATKVSVNSGTLKTIFTVDELKSIIASGKTIALTPETTIFTLVTQSKLAADSTKTAATAIEEAKALINAQIIGDTNPTGGSVAGDEILLTGDLSTTFPANSAEAFARNRAISMSYEAKNLNLNPNQVFELISSRASDLDDGVLDGKTASGDVLTVTDKDTVEIDLSQEDQKSSFGRARSELFSNTIDRLSSGNLSDDEKSELALLGIDPEIFDARNKLNIQAEKVSAALLVSASLPDFQSLPLMTDEDAGAGVAYTLNANKDVNVTVNAPGEITIDETTGDVTVASTATSWVTPMSRYNSEQLPVLIRANNGDSMTLNLNNNLAEDSTIHWHGFEIPASEDGGPDVPVAAATSKAYQFTLQQPAAPLWFHPHPDLKTGEQVYQGLAGVFLIEDSISQQLESENKLPSGAYDLPLMVQDRRFADDADSSGTTDGVRELRYMDSRMDVAGMLGDKILVNGTILPKLGVETRQYRLRLFNTSNARNYDFALSNGAEFMVVGTDGGLIDNPVKVSSIRLGVAERAEIVIDFGDTASFSAGESVMLISKAFSPNPMGAMGNMQGMSGGSMGGSSFPSMGGGSGAGGSIGGGSGAGGSGGSMSMMEGLSMNGARLDIMRFDVSATVTADDVTLYTSLPATAEIKTRLAEADAVKTRQFVLSMSMGAMGQSQQTPTQQAPSIAFKINGKSFDMSRVDETIYLNSQKQTEVWEITNASPMAHPFHAHAIQWQLLDRNGDAAQGSDLGPQDTVLVQPGETVRIIGEFDPTVNDGKYMYHCHILEHEDAGMMGFFEIKPNEVDPN